MWQRLPITMTIVILTVLTLARGMIPRELARRLPLSRNVSFERYNIVLNVADIFRQRQILTIINKNGPIRPYGPYDDCIACCNNHCWEHEQSGCYQWHVNLPAPWLTQIYPALCLTCVSERVSVCMCGKPFSLARNDSNANWVWKCITNWIKCREWGRERERDRERSNINKSKNIFAPTLNDFLFIQHEHWQREYCTQRPCNTYRCPCPAPCRFSNLNNSKPIQFSRFEKWLNMGNSN